ncbi:MAG: PQQ-dependent dehydrogenase, methanol/ethanol family [Alphaproteobacteria bacterium]|nr:PQQ-dependent dehydrogenase, methanol/ethanol family [Alphaproteobacteria bacterium]
MKSRWALLASAGTAALAAGFAGQVLAADWTPVTDERLLSAEKNADDWLIYGRSYSALRHSPLDQINKSNVKNLKVKFQQALGTIEGQEVTPVVNNGIMIVAVSHERIDAIDVTTGKRLWRHDIKIPNDATQFTCCGKVTRGASLYGDKVYFATLDSRLLAIDAKDGKLAWEKTLADYKAGYTLTMAPTIVKGKVMVGFSGGEFGIVGQILALDSETGNEVWKHRTIPQPGEPGYDTWGKDSAKYGGGAAWLTASYDPETNLTFWGTGNPAPWNSDMRPGDNLYSNSIIALDADTGKQKWYFQHVPNDAWDWDSMNEALLINAKIGGKDTKAVIQAHKNGFLYTFDRASGKCLQTVAFAPYDWGNLDENCNMVVKPDKRPGVGKKAYFCPSYFGGKGWAHMAYNPDNSTVFIPMTDMCVTLHHEETTYKKGTMYLGAGGEIKEPGKGGVTAVDVSANKVKWTWKHNSPLQSSSAVSTAGGLVFIGTFEGEMLALDQDTGEKLWSHMNPSGINAGTISFSAGGKQHIAVVSGYGGAFPLWAGTGVPPHIKDNVNPGATLTVYALD